MNLKSTDQMIRFNGALYKNMPSTIMAYHVKAYKDNLQAM